MNPGILLAAAGITTLEFTEAGAVGVALYAEFHTWLAFGAVALGTVVVIVPTVAVGSVIGLLPAVYVRLIGGALLLYFGLRLTKSARRSVHFSRKGTSETEEFQKGMIITGFSVGAVEAFEAAIVLVGLFPNGFDSTLLGMALGVIAVVVATYVLRSQVRKVKQASMKVVVSALLLSFSTFWFGEAAFGDVSDLLLIPLFAAFVLLVHWFTGSRTGHSRKKPGLLSQSRA